MGRSKQNPNCHSQGSDGEKRLMQSKTSTDSRWQCEVQVNESERKRVGEAETVLQIAVGKERIGYNPNVHFAVFCSKVNEIPIDDSLTLEEGVENEYDLKNLEMLSSRSVKRKHSQFQS